MKTLLVAVALLLASFVAACGGDQPTATESQDERQAVEPAQAAQAASEPDQQRPGPTESDSEPPPVRAERQSSAQSGAEQQGEPTEVQEEPETPPTGLTDVRATVIEDADVRVRPGLPWPVLDQLSAGEEVVVLNAASGWLRISYGDDREGWIRTPALDLGEIENRGILYESAPAIIAEWQGEQYGVMGQSADGATVRLLPLDDELAQIVSAPIDEATLLADDITVHDLPILIGDESVVFPGDDFRRGTRPHPAEGPPVDVAALGLAPGPQRQPHLAMAP